MSTTTNRGLFVWHDLVTTDPAAAAGFYTRVAGWEMKPWGHNVPYTLCVTPAGPVGGIGVLPEDERAAGASPYWLCYIATPDLDATIAQATGLGARVLKGATAIEGTGRYALLADPQGAAFGVYTPAQPAPPPSGGTGQFVWHELACADIEAALGFYRALFGWEEMHRMDMGAMGPYLIFGSAGTQRGGMYRRPQGQAGAPHWMAYVHVPSADTATTVAVEAGARVLHGPADIPGGGRITMMLDPQGAAIAVHSAAMEVRAPAAQPAVRKKAAGVKPAAAKKVPAKKAAAKKAAARKGAAKKAAAKRRAPAKKAAARRKPAPARRKSAAKKAARRAAAKRRPAARKAARRAVRRKSVRRRR